MKKKKRAKKSKPLRTSVKLRLKKNSKKRKYTKKYLVLRNSVLLRDLYECQLCKATGLRLEVHHIIKWSSQRSLRQNKRNLISLCKECHQSIRNKEEKYAHIFKRKIAANTARYRRQKLTFEEIIRRRKEQEGLTGKDIVYKSPLLDKQKAKKAEHYLRTTWRAMKNRTTNPSCPSFRRYGGRGIKVCEEWAESFGAFKKYVMENLGERPVGHSLDRINNDGNYEPSNIRWAPPAIQRQNNSAVIFDRAMAEVAFILFHKFRKKQIEIVRALKINNPTAVRNIVLGNSWLNITHIYKKLVRDQGVLSKIEDWESKNEKSSTNNGNNGTNGIISS